MIRKKPGFTFVLLSAFVASFLMAASAEAQRRGENGEVEVPPLTYAERLVAIRQYYELVDSDKTVGPPAKMCNVLLEVDPENMSGEPHLAVGDQLFLAGPTPNGDYNVNPIKGNWKKGAYLAEREIADPNRFNLMQVIVEPHGNGANPMAARVHRYHMSIDKTRGGCPSYVTFYSLGHVGEPVGDHPGHAGTRR